MYHGMGIISGSMILMRETSVCKRWFLVAVNVCEGVLFFLFRLVFTKQSVGVFLRASPESVMFPGLFGSAFSPHHR
jgi:hypothetical protein